MKTIQRINFIVPFLFFLYISLNTTGQNAEKTVTDAVNSINQKLEDMRQLARQKQIYKAMAKLEEAYDEMDHERKWSTFDDKYREAKKKNPGFDYTINGELPPQLSPSYWQNFKEKCDRILAHQDVVIEGMKSAVFLNDIDKVVAYGKQLKTIYETMSGVVENLGSANVPKFGYDLYGNVNDFVDNYKEIEKAYVSGLEIDASKAKWNVTIARAEKNKAMFDDYMHYIQNNISLIEDYRALLRHINHLKAGIDSGPMSPLIFGDYKYTWDYEPFQKKVKEACQDFEEYEIKCEDFKRSFEKIKKEARADWGKVKNNILVSDDKENKKKIFLNDHLIRWTDFKEIVDRHFELVFNKYCGVATKKKEVKSGSDVSGVSGTMRSASSVSSPNMRTLNILLLNLLNTSGEPVEKLIPGKMAYVQFKAKWDGKWLDRVQMKILVDNDILLDEMLTFRDNMGKFQTDFTKTIVIPKMLGSGPHKISLQMARDPHILNKSITLNCPVKTVSFLVGEADNVNMENPIQNTDRTDINQDDAIKELFAGAKAKTAMKPVNKPETIQTVSSGKSYTGSTGKIMDKYWEKTLPLKTKTEWYSYHGKTIIVKHLVGDRSICYQIYYDKELKYLSRECFHENFAIKHGPYRNFKKDELTQKVWLSQTGYYRLNKAVGPWVEYNKDQSIASISYYIDGKKVEPNIYRQQRQVDKSLPPPDCYQNYDWFTVRTPELEEKPELITMADFQKYRFNYPDKYGLRKSVTSNSPWGVGTKGEKINCIEKIYADNNIKQELGRWAWDLTPNGKKINNHTIKFGNLKIIRRNYLKDGTVKELLFRLSNDIGGTRTTFSQSKSFKVGPHYKNQNGKINISYYDGKGHKITKAQYADIYKNNQSLPHPDIYKDPDALRYPKYIDYPTEDKPGIDNKLFEISSDAILWKGSLAINEIRVEYIIDHHSFVIAEWKELERKTWKTFHADKGFYHIDKIWYRNGKLRSFLIRPDVGQPFYIEYDDLGMLKKKSERRKDFDIFKKYLPNFTYPEPDNPSIITSIPEIEIPAAEITPLYLAYKEGLNNPTAKTNIDQFVVSQPIPTKESVKDNSSKDNSSEAENYQQLQRQELNKLLNEVNKKIEAATKSFDTPYWEKSQGVRATDNPKQESLDLMRQAAQIASKAKYPENEGGLNYLIAYKLIDFSGRVFAYEAKQGFFLLAAKLVVKTDQLIPKNKYLKEDLSEAYCRSAEIWRELTRKALWGNHPYNKMACDKMVIRQYERAIQADPNNKKAKRILEQLKAPKKPVPAVVEKFEKIEPETWNEAQTIMTSLAETQLEKQLKPPEKNFTQVADMTLEHTSGTVSIMRSGMDSWEKITDNYLSIYIGDKIKTSADASGVSLSFTSDNAFLAIKNNAEVEIWSERKFLIKRGDASIVVTKKGSKFLVITPTCAVGVRGTHFEVSVAPDKSTTTYLYEGVVETRNGTDIGYLVPGQKMIAGKGEEKLRQSTFNARTRLASNWSNFDTQKKRHEQIKNTVAVRSTKTGFTGSKRTTGSAKTRTKSGSSAYYAKPTVSVKICGSPDNQFHSVLVSRSVDYGDASLSARCPVKVSQNTPMVVKWYYNNGSRPVNVGNYQVDYRASFFDATLISYDAPLNPGSYRVEFVIKGRVIGKGSVQIISPARVNVQTAQQLYLNSVKVMDNALLTLNEGNFTQSGQLSSSAMPGLRKALYNAPALPDVYAVMQTARAIISLEKVDQAVRRSDVRNAKAWLKVSKGQIQQAFNNCQDQQFKGTIQKLKTVILQIDAELR